MPTDLSNIPKGSWVRRESDTVIIGAALKDAITFNLVSAIVWSFSMFIFPSALFSGELILSIFGLPFFLMGIWLWHSALMSLFGHVEIRLDTEEGSVFSGIGRIGKIRTCLKI